MKQTLRTMRSVLGRLHRDEGGSEGLEKLLILAAIVLPLLALLIWFRDNIKDWVKNVWNSSTSDANNWDPKS